MQNLIEEFDKRRQLVVSMHSDEAKTRLAGFLNWMESKPSIETILDTLKRIVNIDFIILECDRNTPPNAATLEEIAAVGLFLMEKCRDGKDLFRIAMSLGITPTYSSSNVQDYTNEAAERFIEPTLDYIEDKLRELNESITVDSIVNYHLSKILFSIITENYPSTADRLQKIAEYFAAVEDEGEWFNVGNSCREAFKTFTSELRKSGKIDVTDEFKTGDVKNILKHALGKAKGSGRFKDTLIKLVDAAWNHSQSIIHRQTSRKYEAFRIFLWTALSISEIALVLEPENGNE